MYSFQVQPSIAQESEEECSFCHWRWRICRRRLQCPYASTFANAAAAASVQHASFETDRSIHLCVHAGHPTTTANLAPASSRHHSASVDVLTVASCHDSRTNGWDSTPTRGHDFSWNISHQNPSARSWDNSDTRGSRNSSVWSRIFSSHTLSWNPGRFRAETSTAAVCRSASARTTARTAAEIELYSTSRLGSWIDSLTASTSSSAATSTAKTWWRQRRGWRTAAAAQRNHRNSRMIPTTCETRSKVTSCYS